MLLGSWPATMEMSSETAELTGLYTLNPAVACTGGDFRLDHAGIPCWPFPMFVVDSDPCLYHSKGV